MSRNFTADVDTQREYFNAAYFNQTGSTQQAKYDTTLLKPLFNDPDKWKLAINRFRIPLSGIPLTRNNIPFQKWAIGIGYEPQSNDWTDAFSYVPQYNPKTVNNSNQLNSVSNQIAGYTYLSINGLTEVATTFSQKASFPIDNAYGLDWADISGTSGYLYSIHTNGSIYVYSSSDGTQYFTEIPGANNNACLCSNKITGDFYVGRSIGPTNTITSYSRTGNTWSSVGNTFNLPRPVNNQYDNMIWISNPTAYIFYCGQAIAGAPVGTDVTVFQYTSGNPNPINTFNFSYTGASISNVEIVTDGFYIYILYIDITGQSILTKYDTFMNQLYQQNVTAYNGPQIINQILIGFDQNGNLLYSYDASGGVQTAIRALNVNDFTVVYNSADPISNSPQYNNTVLVYPKPLVTTPVDSGPYPLYTYQDYLNKINDAFITSFNSIKTTIGASFLPTEPPRVVYDATSKLFSLIVEGQYLTLNNDGSRQYKVMMNTALWDKFYFPYNEGSPAINGYYDILLQNNGTNAIQGNGSATLPQFIYVQQEDSTIYQFFDLTRIIVGTTMIPVSGDADARTFSNNLTTNNSSITMITDVVPDTSTLTNSSALIYIPAGILRWYNLYAQQPFGRIDIIMYYETKDGNIYTIDIPNSEYFSVKLEFKKGPGDF